MSENKSSQEKTLKENEKIENHIKNHEIPKNEAENQKCSHEESLKENEEIEKINNLQEQLEDEVDYDADEEEDQDDDDEEEDQEEEEEYVEVDLSKLKDLNCPICDGIIKKTKAIKECLHRFCGECIDIYVSNGNKQCPLCFTHFHDQSSLLEDKDYDVLIGALYPNIEKDKKESPIVEESDKGRRIVAGEEPIAAKKPIVEKSDDDTASTQQSNEDRPTKKSK